MEEHYLDTVGVGGSIPPVPTRLPTRPAAGFVALPLRRYEAGAQPSGPATRATFPDDPLSRMRHSASHVMADAVRRLRPNAKVAIGPSIENGFYYDFDTEPFAPEDAARIEAEMTKIIAENLPFVRHVVPRAEALRAVRVARREIQGRDHRLDPGRRGGLVLPARRLHRPVPRPARRAHRRHQGVQGDVVRGRLLARRRAQRAAPARLRDRFTSQAELDAYLAQHRGGQAPRPPDAGQGARPVLVRRPGRARASRSGTRRARSSATRSRTSSGARTSAAATTWSTRRTWRASSCSRPRATSRTTRTTCSAAWSWTASATSSSR